MTKGYTLTLLAFLFLILSTSLRAQVISGTLTYVQSNVVSIDPTNSELTVQDATGFLEGSRVLIIQMQGAAISEVDNSTFGDVSNMNGAGLYEIGATCSISGNTLVLDMILQNTFAVSGTIQVIQIPQYGNLTVNGTLTAPAWNGTQGGILVIEATSIDLLADITMDGKGFRGGGFQNSGLSCSWAAPRTAYFYNNSGDGGYKGEGIANYIANKEYGKGAQANGGGGGNDHNSGGGGGGNSVSGGPGGTNGDTGFFDCKGFHPGVGGKAQSPSGRLFMGGGGGAGHGNNGLATDGGTGGGIIILLTQSVNGNFVSISSNGTTALNTSYNAADPGGDAAGGGGAGGSIHLDIPTFTGNFSVSATGGNGGDVVHTEATNDCFGPGGGGAGGMIKFQGASPGGISTDLLAGLNGTNEQISGVTSCEGSSQGSGPGNPGQIIQNVGTFPESTNDNVNCNIALAVELFLFEANSDDEIVNLYWETLTETNNDYFSIERIIEGDNFTEIGKVQGAGTSNDLNKYSFKDSDPAQGMNYYRLKQVDFDGRVSYSKILALNFAIEPVLTSVHPNPVNRGENIEIEFNATVKSTGNVKIFDTTGRLVNDLSMEINSGLNRMNISVEGLSSGVFVLKIVIGDYSFSRRILISE